MDVNEREAVFQKTKQIVMEVLDVDADEVEPESNLIEIDLPLAISLFFPSTTACDLTFAFPFSYFKFTPDEIRLAFSRKFNFTILSRASLTKGLEG